MKKFNAEHIRLLFFGVAFLVFCVSAFLLFRKGREDQKAVEIYKQVQTQAVTFAVGFGESGQAGRPELVGEDRAFETADGISEGSESFGGIETSKKNEADSGNDGEAENSNLKVLPWYELAQVDFSYLQSVNPDICGYLIFENEDICYPILHGESNDTYLRTTYLGEHSTSGSIFMDAANATDFSDSHIIIYGHNMKNRSMFGKLKYYMTEKGYYENHMYFQIHMPDRIERYQIFEYKVVDANDAIYRLDESQTDKEQSNKEQSNTDQSTTAQEDEDTTIITLSTCSGDEKRMIVRGVKIEVKGNEIP